MDFTANLIDLIRDPLSTILIDCRAITHLIAQEESFHVEFEKVQKDTDTLFIVFNQYLQKHIFSDGQVRAQNQEEASSKQFFFESLIQRTVQFRSNLIALLQTVQSIGKLELFQRAPDGADAPISGSASRSLYALLKYKLQESMMSLLEATRGLMKACSPSSAHSQNHAHAATPITTEYLQNVATGFLTQIRCMAGGCERTELGESDFLLLVTAYELASVQFVRVLKEHCRFDISDKISAISINIENLKRLASEIHQWVLEGRGLDATRLQHNVKLEQCLFTLVGNVKVVIPLVNQSINRQASASPLQTSIELIDLVKLEQQLYDIMAEEEEEDDSEEDSEVSGDHDDNSNVNNISIQVTDMSVSVGEDSGSIKRNGFDLPSISLTESDDEEEPMIWSLPIAPISADPFKRKEAEAGAGASGKAGAAANSSIKVYSSKDFNIKAVQARSSSSKNAPSNGIGGNLQGSASNSKLNIKGWALKNPFRKSKSRENLQDHPQGTSNPSTPTKDKNKKTGKTPPPLPHSLSQQNLLQQLSGSSTTKDPASTPSLSQSTTASISAGSGSSNKWVASLPSSRSMNNLMAHSDRRLSTIFPSNSIKFDESDYIDSNLGEEVVIIESPSTEKADPMDTLEHDYFDTPLGLRGSTQDPGVELFEPAKDIQIEEVGAKSKRYTNPVLVRLDRSERHIEHYKLFFSSKEQYNFINNIPSLGGHVIISVLKQQESGNNNHHRAIIRTKNGVEKIFIASQSPKEKDIVRSIQGYLKPIANAPRSSFKSIKSEKIIPHLLDFEKIDITKRYHFFVMFCGDGQSTEREMLANQKVSREFEDFYKFLGNKVPTKDWNRFNGGLDTRGNSDGEFTIYTELQGMEIVFHVSNLIPVDRRKEILARNTCVIIYHEGKSTINPSTFTSSKHKIFFDVKKVKVDDGSNIYYKLGVASNSQVPPFGPMLSDPPLYQKQTSFKKYLITKLINAENSVYTTQHLMQELTKQRSAKLDDIVTSVI